MKLQLDPTACQAYGLCHEEAPNLVDLDEWGYAQPRATEVPPGEQATAEAAVRICPNAALRLAQR